MPSTEVETDAGKQATGCRRFSARPISSGARTFYEQQVGLALSPETIKNHLVFECGDGTTLLVYGRGNPNQADHTQVRFWSDGRRGTTSPSWRAGVVFEEYDFPTFKTVDCVATTAGIGTLGVVQGPGRQHDRAVPAGIALVAWRGAWWPRRTRLVPTRPAAGRMSRSWS